MQRFNKSLSGLIAALIFCSDKAFASSSQPMPWEGPLQLIADSISGNTTKLICVIAIVLCGLGLAFGEGGGGVKKGLQIVLGISLAVGAASIVSNIFGFTGGVTF